jgi:hypothetical protein
MSKKHFIQFAAEIKALVDAGKHLEAAQAARIVASIARQDNPRFDSHRFYTACGL